MMASRENQFSFFLFLVLLLSGERGVQGEVCLQRKNLNDYRPTQLFVFGDSYADTGNTKVVEPYGMTFPGKPAGRSSDGRILTDYIANYWGLKSPVPYNLRKRMPQDLKYGINFAFGGTGVFDTSSSNPNMTIQIDFFDQLIKDKVHSFLDLNNSLAYVSITGNDYMHYLDTNGSIEGFSPFIDLVIRQTITNLIRIQNLGVKKIIVSSLQTLHCIPKFTESSSFHQCNSTVKKLVALHNHLLKETVTKINQERKDHIQILDLYDSFMSVINKPSASNIQNPLKPCCIGVNPDYYCGDVENNEKKYVVCDKPESAFFFDRLHPSQAGWYAVFNKLQKMGALDQIFHEAIGQASY